MCRVDKARKVILNGIDGTEKLGGIEYGWATLQTITYRFLLHGINYVSKFKLQTKLSS